MSDHPLGHVPNLTNEEYHSGPGVSKSHLDVISPENDGCAAAYYHRYLAPEPIKPEPTADMIIGTAIHAAVLEPELFEQDYIQSEKFDRRTKIGKQEAADFEAANEGKIILDPDDFQMIINVRDAVYRHPTAGRLLNPEYGLAEQSFYAIDPETGELRKCRYDLLTAEGGMAIDLKSTKSASPAGFGKAAGNMRYYLQPPYYTDTQYLAVGERPKVFAFVAVEKKPPYLIGIYYVYADEMDRSRSQYRKDLNLIAHHRANGVWPDWGFEPQPLVLPGYVKYGE